MRTGDRGRLLDIVFNAQYDDIIISEQVAEIIRALMRQNLSVAALRLFRDEFIRQLGPHVD